MTSDNYFQWVAQQRVEHKLLNEGKKSLLTQDRLEKLNAIAFAWYGKDRSEDFDWDCDGSSKGTFG